MLSSSVVSALDGNDHLRQHSAGDRARGDVSYANCAHRAVKGLGIRVRVDRELGEPQLSSGGGGVFEQQAADPLADGLRIDEHHAQDASG